MSFKCGIVGLPNVGKSTLFNALTDSSKAQAANFPFCTIDPNIGVVPVPDSRLANLSKVSKSKKVINTTISFVDIAGLVKGASKGEGLGNKFLSHIREVDAIIHMIRCFDSDDIQNVNQTVDPVRDLEIIETEMMLADLESITRRLEKNNKRNIDEEQLKVLENALDYINNDKDINILKNTFDKKLLKESGLLSLKPKIFVCNVDEKSLQNGNGYTKSFIDKPSMNFFYPEYKERKFQGKLTTIVLPLPKGNEETIMPWLQKQGRKIYRALSDFEPIAWNANMGQEGYIVIETGIRDLPEIISHKGPAPWENGAIEFLKKYPNATLNNERLEIGKKPKKRTISKVVNALLPEAKIVKGLIESAKPIQRVPWLD